MNGSLIRRQERLKSFQLMFVLKSLLRPNLWQPSSNQLRLHSVLTQPNHPNCDPKNTILDFRLNPNSIQSSWFLLGFLTLNQYYSEYVKMGQFRSNTVSNNLYIIPPYLTYGHVYMVTPISYKLYLFGRCHNRVFNRK